jgi:endonuclease/exonuclease/phosphatase family metal-dependent hydrolase
LRVTLPYDRPIVANYRLSTGPRFGPASLYPIALLALTALTLVAPQRTGLLALAQVFAPFLFLPLLLLVPFAFVRQAAGLRVLVLLSVLVFGVRHVPLPAFGAAGESLAGPRISVLSWNVFIGNRRYEDFREELLRRPADVVVLQESNWDALGNDAQVADVYPYRLTGSYDVPPGMALLSVYPVIEHGTLDGERTLFDIPRLLWARLDLGEGRSVKVVSAHPIAPYTTGRQCATVVCFEPEWRDEQIDAMRSRYIGPMLSSGEPFILVGDFNVTDREPAYADLSDGLRDAFREAGEGVGTTWRPVFLMEQRMALLRIDYQFSSPNVVPVAAEIDCTPSGSDHCMVTGQYVVR